MRKANKGTLSATRAYGDRGFGKAKSTLTQQARMGPLQAIYQDLGAGDGTWATPNPRALHMLPQLLMQLELIEPLVDVMTNLHFLVQKARERGISEVHADLEQAAGLVKSVASKGVSGKGGQDPPPDRIRGWEGAVRDSLLFVRGNLEALAEDPRNMFVLGRTWSSGGLVPDAVLQVIARAEAAVQELLNVGEMVEQEQNAADGQQQETALEQLEEIGPEHLARVVQMLLHLRVVLDQGIYRAMDGNALEQLLRAERDGKKAVQAVVAKVSSSQGDDDEDIVELVGRIVTAEICTGATPHWEKEEVFAILAEIFLQDDEFDVVPFEPEQACVSLTLRSEEDAREDEQSDDARGGSREERLRDVLCEVTKCDGSRFEIKCVGDRAIVTVSYPEERAKSKEEKHGDAGNDGEDQNEDEAEERIAPRKIANRLMFESRDAESPLSKSGLVVGSGSGDGWREVCLYVSSTVQDMKAERTILSRFVLPALRAACRRRRIHLRWLHLGSLSPASLEDSLRWVKESGASLPEEKPGPLLVALVGRRVGWVPGAEEREAAAGRDERLRWITEMPFAKWSLQHLELACAMGAGGSGERGGRSQAGGEEGGEGREGGREREESGGGPGGGRKEEGRGVGIAMVRDHGFCEGEEFEAAEEALKRIFAGGERGEEEVLEEVLEWVGHEGRGQVVEYAPRLVRVGEEAAAGGGGGGPEATEHETGTVVLSGMTGLGLKVFGAVLRQIDALVPLPDAPDALAPRRLRRAERRRREVERAGKLAAGTRGELVGKVLRLVERGQEDVIVGMEGARRSGRTVAMAQIMQEARRRAGEEGEGEEEEEEEGVQGGEGGRTRDGERMDARAEGEREGEGGRKSGLRGAKVVGVIRERWESGLEWMAGCLEELRGGTGESSGEVSMKGIADELMLASARGVDVVLVLDGLSEAEQDAVVRMALTLRKRGAAGRGGAAGAGRDSRQGAEAGGISRGGGAGGGWGGTTGGKGGSRGASRAGQEGVEGRMGVIKVVLSTTKLRSPTAGGVRTVLVEELGWEERRQVCVAELARWGVEVVGVRSEQWREQLARRRGRALPVECVGVVCDQRGGSSPQFLAVAMRWLVQMLALVPGQIFDAAKEIAPDLPGLYLENVIPLLEDQGEGSEVLGRVLSVMATSRSGLVAGEMRWVLSSDRGEPCDDGLVQKLVEVLRPYGSECLRSDGAMSVACPTMRWAVAKRYAGDADEQAERGASMLDRLKLIEEMSAKG